MVQEGQKVTCGLKELRECHGWDVGRQLRYIVAAYVQPPTHVHHPRDDNVQSTRGEYLTVTSGAVHERTVQDDMIKMSLPCTPPHTVLHTHPAKGSSLRR